MSAALATRTSLLETGDAVSRRRTELVPLGIVAALTIGTFLLHLSQMHQSLFGDELWTYQQLAGKSFSGMLHAIRPPAENAPPLFFILAWEAAKHGDPSVWIRVPSLICGAATVPVIYLLGRDTVGRVPGLIAAAAFALSPFATYYGIEARPYAITAFFVALSTLALVRAVRTGAVGWWVFYALAAAAAAYSGYTAVFVLVVQAAWAMWTCRRRALRPLLANLAVVLLYIPWLPHVGSKGLAVIGFLEPFGVHNVVNDLLRVVAGYPYASLHAIPTVPGLGLLGVCALAGLTALLAVRSADANGGHRQGGLKLLVALALATPAGLALYSLVSTDIWDPRDLYASLPAAMIVLGALIAAIPGQVGNLAGARRSGPHLLNPRLLAVAVVLGTLAFGMVRALGPYARPQFRVAANYLDRVAAPRDPIILYPSFLDIDQDISAQFHRPHLVVNGAPRHWPAAPAGGEAFVVFDGHVSGPGRLPVPRPRGYVLVGGRQYDGLVPFTVLTYRPA